MSTQHACQKLPHNFGVGVVAGGRHENENGILRSREDGQVPASPQAQPPCRPKEGKCSIRCAGLLEGHGSACPCTCVAWLPRFSSNGLGLQLTRHAELHGLHGCVQADAARKAERKKEVMRNKMERKYMRDAASQKDKPEDIKKQLQEVLAVEEQGKVLNKQLRLRKKVLQEAYDHALKKKKVRNLCWQGRLGGKGGKRSVSSNSSWPKPMPVGFGWRG